MRAEYGPQHLLDVGGRERIDPDLREEGLVTPGVLVLGAVREEHEDPRRGYALDQDVEHGLRLCVEPVGVLEHQYQRLALALSHADRLESFEGELPSLRGVEPFPLLVIHRHVEEGKEGSPGGGELYVEVRELLRHLAPDGVWVVN